MATASASEFQKRVGEYSDLARREPVTVTRHGRPALVLLAAEDYERLKWIEERATKAIRTVVLFEDTIEAMRTAHLDHLSPD